MSFKRILSLVLVLCMVLSFFPASAFADNDVVEEEVVEEVVEEPAAEEPAPEEEAPAPAEEEQPAPEEEQPAPAAAEEEEEIVEEEVVAEAQTVSEDAMAAGAVCAGDDGNEYLSVQRAVDAAGVTAIEMLQSVELPEPLSITKSIEFLATNYTITGNITINAPEATVKLNGTTFEGTINLVAGTLLIDSEKVKVDAIEASGGTLSISKGTYRTATAESVDVVGNVTGGTFTEGITDYLCADGYAANASGTVVKTTLKAQIGEGLNRKRFATFGAAAAAAGESDTVILLASSWTGETPANKFTLGDGKTLVVDKNGYKFGTPKPETAAYMVEESSVGTVFTYRSVPIVARVGTAGPATSTDVPYASFAAAVAGRTATADVVKLIAEDAGEYTLALNDTLKVMLNGKTLAVSAPDGYAISKTGPEEGVTTYKVLGVYRVVDMPATPTDASWPVTAEGADYKDTELDAAVKAAMKKEDKVLVLVDSDASVTFADGDFLNVYAGSNEFTAVAAPGVKPVVGNATGIDGVLRYAPTGKYIAKVSAEGKEDQYFDAFIKNGALPYANKNGGTVSFLVAPASGQEYTMIANAEKTLVIDWADYNDEAIKVKAPEGFILKTATEGNVVTYSLTEAVAAIANVGYYETFEAAAEAAAATSTDLTIVLRADIADAYTMDPELATKMTVDHNGHSLTVAAPTGYALRDDGNIVPETRAIGVTNTRGVHTYTITQQFTYTFKPENGEDDIVRTVYADEKLTAAPTVTKVGYKDLVWKDENGEPYPATPTDVNPTSDKTYTAEWTARKYRFIAESMATPTDTYDYTRVVDFGEEITAPTVVPEVEGKTFDYWAYLNKKELWIGGNPTYTKVTFPFTLDAEALDRLLLVSPDPDPRYKDEDEGVFYFYAVFKDDLYSVNFDGNGGTFENSKTHLTVSSIENTELAFGTSLVTPVADPVREGYQFLGWLYEGGLVATTTDLPKTMPAEDQHYVAQWEVKKVAVNVNYADASIPNVSYTIDFGTPIEEPEDVLVAGWTLTGWDRVNSAGAVVTTNVEFPLELDEYVEVINLRAKWNHDTYTLSVSTGEGAWPDGTTEATRTLYYGDPIEPIGEPVLEGYDFVGWFLDDGSKMPATMPGEDIEVTAQYAPHVYNVTYSVATSTDAKIIDPETGLEVDSYSFGLAYGETLPEAPTAVYQGHEYVWVEEHYGYNAPAEMPARDLNFTAEWSGISYTVKFVANGGTINDMHNDPVEEFYVTGEYGDTFPWNHEFEPTLEGYKLHSWMTEDGTHFDYLPATFPAENTTFTVVWEINKYSVTFNANNGKVVNPATLDEVSYYTVKDVEYGSDVEYPDAPVREGYTFTGWKEQVDGFNIPETMPDRALSFNAQWEEEEHSVTLDANGGKFVNVLGEESETFTVTGKFGDNVDYPADPELEGYTLVAWADEEGNNVDLRTRSILAEDVTYTAVWEINKYSVTFNANNGKVVNPATLDEVSYYTVKDVEYGSDVEYPDAPVREGYTFTGWKEQVDGFNIPETMPDRALSFNAQWEEEEHSVTLDANGGKFVNVLGEESETFTVTGKFGDNVDYPADPELEGYTLVAWADEEGNNVDLRTRSILAEDVTYTAIWEIKKVTVTYAVRGGTAIHPDTYVPTTIDFDVVYNFGDELVLPQIARDGFVFGGWVEDTYGWNYPATIPDVTKMVFKAVWVGEDYTLSFDANGGLVTTKALSEGVDLAHTDTVPSYTAVVTATDLNFADAVQKALPITATAPATNPVKEGYTFESWIDENDVHWTAGDLNSLATEFPYVNKSFKANWTVNEYKVKFDGMGGDLINPNTGLPAPGQEYTQMVEFGTAIPFPADPVREGYTFVGWAETKDGYGYNHPKTMPVPKTEDGLVFTAQWEINQYGFIFDANGGSFTDEAGQKSDIFVILENYNTPLRDGSTNIKYPTPAVREGYTLKGWNDDEGNVYVNLTDFPETMPAENMIYEAIWEVKEEQVTFDSKGGFMINPNTGRPAANYDQKVNFGETIPFPADPTSIGYSFGGWIETGVGYGYNYPKTMPDETLKFDAVWTIDQHSITLDANGGAFIDAVGQPSDTFVITEDYDTELLQAGKYPSAPVREGYELIGWAGSNNINYSVMDVPARMPAEDLTLTAIWEIQEYVVVFRPGTAGNAATIVNPLTGRTTKGAEVTFKVTYGEPIPYAEISASGYTFKGWVEDQDGYKLPETMPARAVGLTAMWEGLDYSFTFDANGGLVRTWAIGAHPGGTPYHEDNVPSYTAVYNAENTADEIRALLPLSDPTRAGYTFESWIEKDTGKHWSSEELNTLATKLPYADKTFTANWVAEEHTATFDAGGGIVINPATLVPDNSYTAKFVTDEEIIYPDDPTAVGYEFKGWKETNLELGYKLPITMPGDDLVFEAQWAPIPNTVVYNANGGTVLNKRAEAVEVLTIEAPTSADIYVPTTAPVRYGYTFSAWLDSKDNWLAPGSTAATMPAEGETYTARWEAKKITVNFYAQPNDTAAYETQQVKFDDLVKQPMDPIVTGKVFEGWYTYRVEVVGGELVTHYLEPFDFSKPVDSEENINLVGKWSTALWTVSFDSNGGLNNIPDQIVEHGKKAAAPTTKMYRSGYTFVGWVERNENGTLADTFYDFNNTAVTKDTQLVAIWQGNKVTLRWTDRNVYFVDQEVRVGDFIVRPEFEDYQFQQLIRDGRVENGVHYRLDPDDLWDPMPTETVEENYGANFTFMLKWIRQNRVILVTEKGLDVAYIDDGMTLGEAIDAGLISAPAKPGYKVVWTSNGNPVDEDDVIKEGMTLNATYVVYEPVVTFMTNESVYRTEEVTYGGTVTKPADPKPTELGVKFAGWAEEGSTVLFDFSTPITEDKVLEAVWEAIIPAEHTVTFMNENAVYSEVKVADGETVAKPEDPTPTVLGVKFDAWYEMNSTVPFDFSTPITKNVVLEARWAPFVEEVKLETTLNMADFTGIYVYVGLPEGEDASQYTIESTGGSYRKSYVQDPVAVSTLEKGSGARADMYRFEAAQFGSPEMTDEVNVIVKKDGKVVKEATYSVKSVAEDFLASGLTQDQVYLVKGLQQYGYYGHIMFKNPLPLNPVIDGAPALMAIPSSYAPKNDPTGFGTYVTKFEDKLDLDARIAMNLYYTLADGYSMNDFTYSVKDKNGNEYTNVTITEDNGNKVLVKIGGISSPQMDNDFTVTMTLKSDTTKTATWTRSVITCAYTGSARTSGDGVKFLQALYQYYVYANKQWPNV